MVVRSCLKVVGVKEKFNCFRLGSLAMKQEAKTFLIETSPLTRRDITSKEGAGLECAGLAGGQHMAVKVLLNFNQKLKVGKKFFFRAYKAVM